MAKSKVNTGGVKSRGMEDKKRRAISFTVDNADYEEILEYARIKGHGGRFPASIFAHYAVHQMMKKYPVSEAEIRKYNDKYVVTGSRSMAVQPDAPAGN